MLETYIEERKDIVLSTYFDMPTTSKPIPTPEASTQRPTSIYNPTWPDISHVLPESVEPSFTQLGPEDFGTKSTPGVFEPIFDVRITQLGIEDFQTPVNAPVTNVDIKIFDLPPGSVTLK